VNVILHYLQNNNAIMMECSLRPKGLGDYHRMLPTLALGASVASLNMTGL